MDRERLLKELETSIDFLAAALDHMGGIAKAADALGISRTTLCRYLDHGLAKARWGNVAKLAELGGVPIEKLTRRMGPWPYTPALSRPLVAMLKQDGRWQPGMTGGATGPGSGKRRASQHRAAS